MEVEVCLVSYEAFIGLRNIVTIRLKCCLVDSGVLQTMFEPPEPLENILTVNEFRYQMGGLPGANGPLIWR